MDVLRNKKETVVRLWLASMRMYLVACDNQKSVDVVGVEKGGSQLHNGLWTIQSDSGSSEPASFRFVSVYGKVLVMLRIKKRYRDFHSVSQMDDLEMRADDINGKVQVYSKWNLEETEDGFPKIHIKTLDEESPYYLMGNNIQPSAGQFPSGSYWIYKKDVQWVVEIVDTGTTKKQQLEPEQRRLPDAESSAIIPIQHDPQPVYNTAYPTAKKREQPQSEQCGKDIKAESSVIIPRQYEQQLLRNLGHPPNSVIQVRNFKIYDYSHAKFGNYTEKGNNEVKGGQHL